MPAGIAQPGVSTLTRQGLELVELLRDAERYGFSADDIQVALAQGATDPVDWLVRQWPHLIETVQVLVTTRGKDIPDSADDVGILSPSEAKEALRLSKGDVWSAVARAIQQRQRKVSCFGLFHAKRNRRDGCLGIFKGTNNINKQTWEYSFFFNIYLFTNLFI